MTKEEIREAILGVIAEVVPDEDLSDLKDDEPLRDQIELDSMDFLDIVMELQKRYDVEIPEDDFEVMSTMGNIVNYLAPKLAKM